MRAHVIVMPKRVVSDPQGTTVHQGLRTLGFEEVREVRIGKYVELELESASAEAARSRVDEMCRTLLANHVIEDYRIEIEAPPGA